MEEALSNPSSFSGPSTAAWHAAQTLRVESGGPREANVAMHHREGLPKELEGTAGVTERVSGD